MSTVEVFDERVSHLAEGPWYDERTGRVGWVDIIGRRVLWRDLVSGEVGEMPTSEEVSAVVVLSNGASRVVDLFGLVGWGEVSALEPDDVVRMVRDAERSGGVAADDATLATARFGA